MDRAPPLAVRELQLSFGGLSVLERVSFEAAERELVAIVGPNGAGKTSLLNCVNGVYRATGGTILLDGRDIIGLAPYRIAALGVARAFQHVELFRRMSVLDNLLLGRHVYFRGNAAAAAVFWGPVRNWELAQRAEVEEVVEFFELERYRHRAVGDLPYGVQKLVGLARAFAMRPRLVLLDEPASGLSRQEKEDLARYLLRIRHERAATIVWVEHDLQLVRDLADRIVVLHYGRMLVEGPPEAVLAHPEVVAAYTGAGSTP